MNNPDETFIPTSVSRDHLVVEGGCRLRPVIQTVAHEIAKLLLEHAGTFLQRQEAIQSALYLGMPLHEIERYLDWLDAVRPAKDDEGDSD